MATIKQLADCLHGIAFGSLRQDTVEHLKMHLLDTIGATLIGPKTQEGITIGRLLHAVGISGDIPVIGYPIRSGLLSSMIAQCATTRCTEIDDIHLQSCTTPGSVIVPAALVLANAGYMSEPEDFIVSIVAGYEAMIRLGIAVDGPRVLYKGVWPTYLAAPLGAAATAAKALKLNVAQTAGALSTALTLSTGVAGRIRRDAPFSRWLTVGIAAQNGVLAAFGAQAGFVADEDLLDSTYTRIFGLNISPEALTAGLDRGFYIDETGMKPHPVGRQSLSALEAFRTIVTTHHIEPETIREVTVMVPGVFVNMLDRRGLPDTRLASLSLRYQMGLALYDPDKLLDVRRDHLPKDSKISELMDRIYIKPSRELARYYPEAWPARVEIRTDHRKYACKILHPKGDACNRFRWDEVASKFRRVASPAIGTAKAEQVVHIVRHIDTNNNLADLLEVLKYGIDGSHREEKGDQGI